MTPHQAATTAGEPDPQVTARLARFAQTRDPRALWPDLAVGDLFAARRKLESVARAVLAGQRAIPLDGSTDRDAYSLGVAAFTSGTGALVGRWMEQGLVRGGQRLNALFAEHLDHGRRRAARIEGELMPALDALLARDVVPVVVKGFHTARAYAEEPGVRPMGDVDLVVEPDQIPAAESALRDAGFFPMSRRTRPYKRDWMGAGIDHRAFAIDRVDARSRWRVELHESFDRDFPARRFVRLDAEREQLAPFAVAGRRLMAAGQPLLLLTLACQISSELDVMRLMRVIDLVRVIRTDRASGKLDWDAVRDVFRHTNAARYAFPGLALAERLSPGTVDDRVLQIASDASTWASCHTVARLTPSGGWMDRRDVMTMCMWATSPVDLLLTLGAAFGRSVSRGPSASVAVWRAMIRRAFTGALSVQPREEHPLPARAAAFLDLRSYSQSLTASE